MTRRDEKTATSRVNAAIRPRHIGHLLAPTAVLLLATALLSSAARAGEAGEKKLFLGPYLQETGQTRMTIAWISGDAGECLVRYGLGDALDREAKVQPADEVGMGKGGSGPKAHVYAARLADLKPGTAYGYEVTCGDNKIRGTFETFPAGAAPFTFVAYGDTRGKPKTHRDLVELFSKDAPDFILHTGDFVSSGYNQLQALFFEPLTGVLDRCPLFPTYGNHDGKPEDFCRVFRMPLGKTYYSFDYGDAHFVCLDNIGLGSTSSPAGKEMLEWFRKDISESKAKWKIVFDHKPSFDVGEDHSKWGREDYLPLYRKYGVDLSISAHSHGYQRDKPMFMPGENDKHPITFVITAGGGASFDAMDNDVGPCVAACIKAYHCVVFKIDGDKLTARAIGIDGKEIDTFSIGKNADGTLDEATRASALPETDFSKHSGAKQ